MIYWEVISQLIEFVIWIIFYFVICWLVRRDEKKKSKKVLLFFIGILSFSCINVKALTLCDNTELPDIPSGVNYFVIVRYDADNIYRLYTSPDTSSVKVNGTNLRFYNSSSARYSKTNTAWMYSSSGTFTIGLTINSVQATNFDIYRENTDELIYSANYNLVCTEPEPDIPQDFSIINYIASSVNSFVSYLQTNNIDIHITFIGLCIFNLLVFIIAYIVTHFE